MIWIMFIIMVWIVEMPVWLSVLITIFLALRVINDFI